MRYTVFAFIVLGLSILPQSGDCSDGSDWPTWGGNAQHTFYNPDAQLEFPLPIRWPKIITPEFPINQITVSGNKVLVSYFYVPPSPQLGPAHSDSSSRFNLGGLLCLDAATSAELWRHEYFDISDLPPLVVPLPMLVMR